MSKTNNIDNYVKMSVIGGVIIVTLSIAYYFVIFTPQKESQKIELQKEELRTSQLKVEEKTTALKTCLYQADVDATTNWNEQCKNFGKDKNGSSNLKDGCLLADRHADAVNAAKKNQQEQCYKLYR